MSIHGYEEGVYRYAVRLYDQDNEQLQEDLHDAFVDAMSQFMDSILMPEFMQGVAMLSIEEIDPKTAVEKVAIATVEYDVNGKVMAYEWDNELISQYYAMAVSSEI